MTFKKTFLITLTVLVSYWLIAGLVFDRGQLIFHAATALVGAAYLTTRFLKNRNKWLALAVWPGLVVVCYETIGYLAFFMNQTTAGFIPVRHHIYVRFLYLVFVSALFAGAVTLGHKWLRRKSS